jgi:hypothetical protein
MYDTKLNEFDQLTKYFIVTYKDEEDYLNNNELASQFTSKEWEHMKAQGYSDDGTIQVDTCYYKDNDLVPITNIHEVTMLLLEEMENSDFDETIMAFNDEGDNKIDLANKYACYEFFLEFCMEVDIFKQTRGQFKGGLCIVVDED